MTAKIFKQGSHGNSLYTLHVREWLRLFVYKNSHVAFNTLLRVILLNTNFFVKSLWYKIRCTSILFSHQRIICLSKDGFIYDHKQNWFRQFGYINSANRNSDFSKMYIYIVLRTLELWKKYSYILHCYVIHRGLNVASLYFDRSNLITIFNSMGWNLKTSSEISQTRYIAKWYSFLISDQFHGDWSHSYKLLVHKYRLLCIIISTSMHINRG